MERDPKPKMNAALLWKRPPPSSSKAAREFAKRSKAEVDAATRRRVEVIAAAAAVRPAFADGRSGPTASERLSGVAERVRARIANGTA